MTLNIVRTNRFPNSDVFVSFFAAVFAKSMANRNAACMSMRAFDWMSSELSAYAYADEETFWKFRVFVTVSDDPYSLLNIKLHMFII